MKQLFKITGSQWEDFTFPGTEHIFTETKAEAIIRFLKIHPDKCFFIKAQHIVSENDIIDSEKLN